MFYDRLMPDFLKPDREIRKYGDRLPHWQQGEAMQFVTFRLGDALPARKVADWMEKRRIWRLNHPEPWNEKVKAAYERRFTWRIERWLDHGAGGCLLREQAAREILAGVLMRFDGSRVRHHAWVIMPNHVHLLFSPVDPLDALIRIWKSTSAVKIGKGEIWQRNYRDTMIRDGEHFANAVRYIRRNPRRLRSTDFTLWESDRVRETVR